MMKSPHDDERALENVDEGHDGEDEEESVHVILLRELGLFRQEHHQFQELLTQG